MSFYTINGSNFHCLCLSIINCSVQGTVNQDKWLLTNLSNPFFIITKTATRYYGLLLKGWGLSAAGNRSFHIQIELDDFRLQEFLQFNFRLCIFFFFFFPADLNFNIIHCYGLA